MKGLVHIYTGDGKGKTTAAIGLAIRAVGQGFRVLLVQFLKGMHSGEIDTASRIGPQFEIKRGQYVKKFVNNMTEEELAETKKECLALFEYALTAAQNGKTDMIILDEIMASINCGFVEESAVSQFIREKPENIELVLTGRNAPSCLIEAADYVMEITPVKHPFESGIMARKGIEF